MHELALSRRLVATIEEQAAVHGYDRVKTVRLSVGPFACVEPEALRFGFRLAAATTCAEGAELEIREAPAEGRCPVCHTAVAVTDYVATCAACGGSLAISGGADLKIAELEVV